MTVDLKLMLYRRSERCQILVVSQLTDPYLYAMTQCLTSSIPSHLADALFFEDFEKEDYYTVS